MHSNFSSEEIWVTGVNNRSAYSTAQVLAQTRDGPRKWDRATTVSINFPFQYSSSLCWIHAFPLLVSPAAVVSPNQSSPYTPSLIYAACLWLAQPSLCPRQTPIPAHGNLGSEAAVINASAPFS